MNSEEAVSPVIGVMLMLVVTIIVAAVVSAFAGGLSSATEKAPQASIEVSLMCGIDDGMGGTTDQMLFKHLSGDPIPTKDLAIITYYTNKSGYIYKHEQTASSPGTDSYGFGSLTRVPFLNDGRLGYAGGNPSVDFGNVTWTVGDVLCAYNEADVADLLGINDDSNPHKIADPDFGPGSVVEVKILHIPSGKYIYNKEVVAV
jgi:FlaG/FlaF family flagellin (archaellin)